MIDPKILEIVDHAIRNADPHKVAAWGATEIARVAIVAYESAQPDTHVTVDDIRAKGWSVAVHNDYRQNGERFTFWLFTKNGCAVKGEGRTDAEAFEKVQATITAHEGESDKP